MTVSSGAWSRYASSKAASRVSSTTWSSRTTRRCRPGPRWTWRARSPDRSNATSFRRHCQVHLHEIKTPAQPVCCGLRAAPALRPRPPTGSLDGGRLKTSQMGHLPPETRTRETIVGIGLGIVLVVLGLILVLKVLNFDMDFVHANTLALDAVDRWHRRADRSAGHEPPTALDARRRGATARRPLPARRTPVKLPGQALSFQSHEHAWRIVSVSQEDFAEVTTYRCATCSAVSSTGPICSALTANVESRAFIRVRVPRAPSTGSTSGSAITGSPTR
jgi:hypothetical protein